MTRINDHYLKLAAGYLFPEIGRRIGAFTEKNPDAKETVIKLGIGDVTEPLPPAIIEAMHTAIDEMSNRETFRGYGPEQGYPFLRNVIAEHDYRSRGIDVSSDEIFISDGSKCDTGNILDIFGADNRVAICDPVYPVYVDTNVMVGRTGSADEQGRYSGLTYLPMTADNDFVPPLPTEPVDLIYLCSPNNPTGATMSREAMENWVNYAREHGSIILFDAAYEAYITEPGLPRSIYEIDGAHEVAIEFRSFSKSAGFTGTRCALTVVPQSLMGKDADGNPQSIHKLWNRRQSTKFNGVSYIVQKGAAAAYTEAGHRQVRQLVNFYLENARLLRDGLTEAGYSVHGGVNAPYVWLQTPDGVSSWEFFDQLLSETHVVGTPGAGFGASGEGFFRLSAFNSRENVEEALSRITTKFRFDRSVG